MTLFEMITFGKTTLVLWDRCSIKFLPDLAIYEFDGTIIGQNVLVCLCQQDWEDISLRQNMVTFEKIYVLAELDWGLSYVGDCYGLEIFRRCMQVGLISTQLAEIIICSFFTREVLHRFAPAGLKLIVQKFPFARLTPSNPRIIGDNSSGRKQIRAVRVIPRKYELNRYLCLHAYGIIDLIIHDLRNITLKDNGNNEFSRFFQNTTNLGLELSESINQQIRQFKIGYAGKSTDPKGFFALRDQLILELIQFKEKLIEKESGQPVSLHLANRRLLVVEDNTYALNILKRWLEKYGAAVVTASDGESALYYLNQSKLDGELPFHAVVTDFHLSNDAGFEGDVQGIDLMEICNDRFPELTVRGFTSLPKGIIDKFYNSKNIIYKTPHTVHPLGNEEEIVIKNLAQEIIRKTAAKGIRGPQVGDVYRFYVATGKYNQWISKGLVNYQQAITSAKNFHTKILEKKVRHGIIRPGKVTKKRNYREEWDSSPIWLQNLLFIRLLVLVEAVKVYHNRKFYDPMTPFGYIDWSDRPHFKGHPNFDSALPEPKGFLNLIGFQFRTIDYVAKKGGLIQIVLDCDQNNLLTGLDLFDEEFEFVRNLLLDIKVQLEWGICHE